MILSISSQIQDIPKLICLVIILIQISMFVYSIIRQYFKVRGHQLALSLFIFTAIALKQILSFPNVVAAYSLDVFLNVTIVCTIIITRFTFSDKQSTKVIHRIRNILSKIPFLLALIFFTTLNKINLPSYLPIMFTGITCLVSLSLLYKIVPLRLFYRNLIGYTIFALGTQVLIYFDLSIAGYMSLFIQNIFLYQLINLILVKNLTYKRLNQAIEV